MEEKEENKKRINQQPNVLYEVALRCMTLFF